MFHKTGCGLFVEAQSWRQGCNVAGRQDRRSQRLAGLTTTVVTGRALNDANSAVRLMNVRASLRPAAMDQLRQQLSASRAVEDSTMRCRSGFTAFGVSY